MKGCYFTGKCIPAQCRQGIKEYAMLEDVFNAAKTLCELHGQDDGTWDHGYQKDYTAAIENLAEKVLAFELRFDPLKKWS